MHLILSGASNTNGLWPTWADIIQERYDVECVNVGHKGLGNEAIILRALHTAWQHRSQRDLIIVMMLTSVDKWDWYVDDPNLILKFEKEKHTITRLSKSAPGGFWSTGSWFPLDKEDFKKKYYSQDYFVLRSLQLIATFKSICQQQNWQYCIMFDSPVWSMTEQELIKNTPIRNDHALIKTELCEWLYQSAQINQDIYEPGLIGFLDHESIPWFSNKFGPHPSPKAHLLFAKTYLYRRLDLVLKQRRDDDYIETMIEKMNTLWTQ